MIAEDYEDDAHFCLKCHATVLGLENYVAHRKAGCAGKTCPEPPKSPPPSQLLPPDESFDLKADDFFSSLELRSSSKKTAETQSSSGGKHHSGILTRSRTTAVIQATTSAPKDLTEPQQSKSGKNVWIGGDQLKELGHGDNHSKLIKAVANLERRKEEPPKLDVFDDTDDDSEEYDFDDEESSSDDQDIPPRHHTGGKWKPSSPVQWPRNTADNRDWNVPPPTFTGGKWKPNYRRSSPPPPTHTKGKWPPPSFTGSKWVPKKQEDSSIPPPSFTGSKWVASKKQDGEDIYNKGKGKSKLEMRETENDTPPHNHTKGKWKPRTEEEDDFPSPSYTKGKWKPKSSIEPRSSQIVIPKQKPATSKPSKNEKDLERAVVTTPDETHTKGKWLPPTDKSSYRLSSQNLLRKSGGTVQYWCSPCNRRLASKVVYERHLKSELHFKRTAHDRDFDETDELLIKNARRQKLKLPEPIFSSEEKASTSGSKRKRKKTYKRCDVCLSRIHKYLIGKHLISHYHCRKGDIRTDEAKRMVLENIHEVVLESPFQCGACKFYCNTHQDFLRHWLSPDHTDKVLPGLFFCLLCKYRTEDTGSMYAHLVSAEHTEVVIVMNRSLPIVIKKINPVACPTCHQEFMLNVQLLSHCKRFDHDDSPARRFKNEFICDLCEVGLVSSTALKHHQRIVHDASYFICNPCGLKFETAVEAKRHRKTLQHKYSGRKDRADESLKKKCEYCGDSFGNFLLLKEHLNSVHPERKIRCPHCGMSFTIAQDLSTHLRLKSCKFEEDSSPKALRCGKCPFTSDSTSELIFHQALHEPPSLAYPDGSDADGKNKPTARYKCPVCAKGFPKASLEAHIRQHTQERPYVCGICGKSFARKNNLQFHVKNHEKGRGRAKVSVVGGRPFLCSVCGANFSRKSILQQHMQIHTGKECKCPYVGCVYTARKTCEINQHFKTHLDAKNHACQVCDYRGKTKQLLTRHMTVHADTKKYQCPQCSFTSRDSTHLRRHIRIHTGAKPFSCRYCNYKCNNLENLRKHILSTNKHPGKCIYECKFCSGNLTTPFQTNFAKEFRAHLITRHAEMFGNGAEAATYVAGIYDVHDDSTFLNDGQRQLDGIDDQLDSEQIESRMSPSLSTIPSEGRRLDQMLPGFVVPKEDRGVATVATEHLPDSWSLVGRYDVEEASGTLIPFQSDDSDSLFQGHF